MNEQRIVAKLLQGKFKYFDVDKLFAKLKGESIIFFDTETTGLHPANCQITEIAAIAVKGVQLDTVAKFHRKITLNPKTLKTIEEQETVKPKGKSVKELLEMTRYHSLEMETSEEIEVLNEFRDFCASHNSILSAHNAQFDMKMVGYKIGKIPNRGVIDTMMFARMYFIPALKVLSNKGDAVATMLYNKLIVKGKPSAALGSVAGALGIDTSGWHSALADVQSSIEVFRGIVKHFEEHGVVFNEPEFKSEQKKTYLIQKIIENKNKKS